ncbi:hypothetical protein [Streptomyces iconiensis]|uniref:Uncharacterized protein n=1 Tax=Streptomyces iconiensis TaxID=1384038 RepID=A0ABT7A4K5_9ACTN|nr:hypothetical protein [Streptomyces iconiensis]MDJ1136255.1 hypothetical protein [Streptomyces iconiensis]
MWTRRSGYRFEESIDDAEAGSVGRARAAGGGRIELTAEELARVLDRPLPHGCRQIKCATAFLHRLGKRNINLATCGQLDIDAWWAENTEHARTCLRAFLNWAMQTRHCPSFLSIPAMKVSRWAALSDDERLDALGRLLTDTVTPTRLRIAGIIVLLYTQPVSRIVHPRRRHPRRRHRAATARGVTLTDPHAGR